ncbi:MAG: type IX secretion system protein PorQ [Bacteroidales bacterium]
MRYLYIILLLHIPFLGLGQIGGNQTYQFLSLNTSARAIALGGNTIAIDDSDLNLTYHNPAVLDDKQNTHLTMNYVNYFADINYGYASFAFPTKHNINLAAGIKYLDYGEFQEADESGEITGEFGASEYALHFIASKQLDTNFRIGLTFKPILSHLYEYESLGLAFDAGIMYTDTSGLFTAALTLKNMGFQVKPYHPDVREALPFKIQLGASYKLKNAPFRFIIIGDNLQKPDLTYQSPEYSFHGSPYYDSDREPASIFENSIDKIMRHIIMGVELSPIDNFFIRAGYNYRRRQELKIDSNISTVGFSWGFGFKIHKFYLNYGRSNYHLAGTTNYFSLRTDLGQLFAW